VPRIVVIDAAYTDTDAATAGVFIQRWDASPPEAVQVVTTPVTAAYAPGQLFKRELGGILHLLAGVTWLPEVLLIDAYVTLGSGRKGLGMHLYEALSGAATVIGVAKNPFVGNDTAVPLLRGRSKKPLFITAAGVSTHQAAEKVARMYGTSRIPLMLQLVDRLSKTAAAAL